MKFTINRAVFLAALKKLGKVSGGESETYKKAVYVTATDKGLVMETNALERGMRLSISCRIEETGEFCLRKDELLSPVTALDGDDVEVFTDDVNTVTLRGVSGRFSLIGLDLDKFTHLPEKEPACDQEIRQDDLKQLLSKVLISAEKDDGSGSKEASIGNVGIEHTNGTLRAFATNRYRVSAASCACSEDAGYYVLLPKRAAEAVRDLLGSEETVRVSLSDKACFAFKDMTFLANLCGGNGDRLRNLVNNLETRMKLGKPLIISTSGLKFLIGQIQTFNHLVNRKDKRPMQMKYDASKRALVCQTQNSRGRNEAEFPVKYNGEFYGSYDPDFLDDIISQSREETVTIMNGFPKAGIRYLVIIDGCARHYISPITVQETEEEVKK